MAKKPSHVLVHEQLKELVLKQQEIHNKSLLNMSSTMSSDFVPKIQYESAIRQLEQERLDHAETKQRLLETEDRLEFMKGEVEMLKKQLFREKEQFEKTFGALKNKAIKESSKKIELEEKVSETKEQCKAHEDRLQVKNLEIQALGEKLKKQDAKYQKQLQEIRVKLEQEAYIANVMKEGKARGNRPKGRLTQTAGNRGLGYRDGGLGGGDMGVKR